MRRAGRTGNHPKPQPPPLPASLQLQTVESDARGETRSRGSTGRRPVPHAALVTTVAAFAASRVVFALAGVRMDDDDLQGASAHDMWQLLDVRLLRHDLVASVWHLNSQPPLFNLYAGLVLHLPAALRHPFEVTCSLGLGLVIVTAAYVLLCDLGVPAWVACAVVVVGIVLDPAFVLYENWFTYAYPSAAFATLAACSGVRFVRTTRWGWGIAFFGAVAALYLVNSTYQLAWVVLAAAPVVVALRRQWRRVVGAAAVPVVLVGLWAVKDAAMFGTTTTSSWLGMNLARMVLYKAPPAQLRALERQGRLSTLASVPSFGTPDHYVPRYVRTRHTGVAALDELLKADGAANFNNPLYIDISSQYLSADLTYIRAHPAVYAADLELDARVWVSPTDENFSDLSNWKRLEGYTKVYDRYVGWQPHIDPVLPLLAVFAHVDPPTDWLSYQAVALMAVTLAAVPVLAWRRRRGAPDQAAGLAFVWVTTTYAFVVTTLVEVGENERFRFELGPLPLIATAAVVTAAVRALWRRRSAGRPVTAPSTDGGAPRSARSLSAVR